MKHTRRHYPILLLFFITALSIIAAPRKKGSDDYACRKADYLFLEAKNQVYKGNIDGAYELMEHARKLKPDDKLLGMELAPYYMKLDTADGLGHIDLMEEYVRATPSDLYNGYIYAQICSQTGQNRRALEAWQMLHERFPQRLQLTQHYAGALVASNDSTNLRRALELYDSLEMADDDPVQLAASRSVIHYTFKDSAAVKNEVSKLLAKTGNSVSANVMAGRIYSQLLENDSALVYYNRAIEADPTNGVAYYARANYFNSLNDSVRYDAEVFNALRQPDLEIDVKLAILREYVSKLYTDTAQQGRIAGLFDILVEMHPHQATIHDFYAGYLLSTENYTKAAEQLGYSLDADPNNNSGWITLGQIQMRLEKNSDAAATATRGLHYFPGDGALINLRLVNLNIDGKTDEAYREACQAILDYPTMPRNWLSDIYSVKADVEYKRGEFGKAVESYNRALELQPDNYMAMNNLAYYISCKGDDLDRALSLIKTAMSARPGDPTFLDTYAWVMFRKGNYAKAKEAIDQVLDAQQQLPDDEPSAEVFEHAGDIYFMNSLPDKALEFWKEALALDPANELLKRKVTHKTFFFK